MPPGAPPADPPTSLLMSLAAQDLISRDWHNTYAAFLVGLSDALRELPNDFARQKLLDALMDGLKPLKKK